MAESTQKKRILYLVTSSAWGGAERYVARLAQAASKEFDVLVAAGPSQGHELFSALPAGTKTFTLKGLKSAISPLKDMGVVSELASLIDTEGIDLVHCNSSKAGLVGALAATRAKRHPRLVYTAHGWGFLERRGVLFRMAVMASEHLAAGRRDATIVLSEQERGVALARHLATPANIHLIPHGIDAGEISFLGRDESRAELSRLSKTDFGTAPIVGTIANAYPAKALPLLVAAFNTAPESAHLVIIGDGPAMAALQQARDASPAKERVHLLGAVHDAARLLKGIDLFVLSSVKEGMPWVILEASLAGTPILATRVGAIPTMLVEGADGMLVPPGDVRAFGTALRMILTDSAISAKLKNNAPRIAERRSGRVMIEATMALYRTLLVK